MRRCIHHLYFKVVRCRAQSALQSTVYVNITGFSHIEKRNILSLSPYRKKPPHFITPIVKSVLLSSMCNFIYKVVEHKMLYKSTYLPILLYSATRNYIKYKQHLHTKTTTTLHKLNRAIPYIIHHLQLKST